MERLKQILLDVRSKYAGFEWVGFYFMNHESKVLELGPYLGEATDHVAIPFGKGICGQVAVSGQTYHAPDVQSEDNYIACSLETKSELVIPIFDAEGVLVAQLDIDSHSSNTFSESTVGELEKLCEMLGQNWGEYTY